MDRSENINDGLLNEATSRLSYYHNAEHNSCGDVTVSLVANSRFSHISFLSFAIRKFRIYGIRKK